MDTPGEERDIKNAALAALHAGSGAEAYFTELKESNPTAFAQFLKAILPSEAKTQGRAGEHAVITWQND